MSTTQYPDPNDRERGVSGAATKTMDSAPQKPDRPSMRQMTVSALTAVSATALLSFVGVWGTVFGMGLLSVLTVLGNYMYSSFIQRTAEKVKQARPVNPRPRDGNSAATRSRSLDDATRVDLEPITAEHENLAGADTTVEPTQPQDEDDRPAGRLRTAWDSMVERYGLRRIVLSIVAVFVLLAGTVTTIELMAGKPMSDIVRNEGGSGTSFGESTSEGSGADDSGGSSDPDGESDQQDSPGGDQQDEQPPADEQPEDEPQQDGDQQDSDPQDEQPPADEPEDEQPPADEQPEDEQPPAEEPQQDGDQQDSAPQQDAPPAE